MCDGAASGPTDAIDRSNEQGCNCSGLLDLTSGLFCLPHDFIHSQLMSVCHQSQAAPSEKRPKREMEPPDSWSMVPSRPPPPARMLSAKRSTSTPGTRM